MEFRSVVDHSADAILLVTSDGRVAYMNRAAEALFGRTLAEMGERRHTDLVAERYRRHNLLEISGQLEAVRAGAPPFTAEWTAFPVDPARGLYGVVVRDLTDRWLAEQAIRRSEANFRALIESHPQMVGVVDEAGTIRYVNPAAAGFVGHDEPGELVGRALFDILHPDAFSTARDLLATRGGPTRELRFAHREGRVVVGEVSSLEVEYDGQVGLLLIVHDVTARREMQAQMMVAARLASVGTLAAGVAHEINNPLAYISANLEYAVRELARLGQPEAAAVAEIVEALEEARQGAERVRVIVRDLKTFSRASDDESRIPLDPRTVLEAAAKMCWTEIRHRANLVRELGPVPDVLANEARLGQVFLNLLVNAAQAIPEGHADANEIRVTTRTDEDGRAVIEVADTGAGIPGENLTRIFDPFFTTKPTGLGTGLGLSICHGIVQALGGHLSAESAVGRGSLFRVVLPAADATVAAAEGSSPPESASTRRLRVLSVDDEPRVGSAVKRILGQHEVVTLTDGREALARIRAGERYDAVLCDLMMPVMTGMDLHAALREVAPDQAERMVFLTGGAFTPRAREFLEQVANPHLEKPFDAAALHAVLARLA